MCSNCFAALSCDSFMEVVKAASRQGTVAHNSIAIRADQKGYSYTQLLTSALKISSLLCGNKTNTVSWKPLVQLFLLHSILCGYPHSWFLMKLHITVKSDLSLIVERNGS